MESRPWQRHYDYNVPFTIRYPRLPLHDLIGIPAQLVPRQARAQLLRDRDDILGAPLLVLRMANALGKLGVQKGDRVGMHLPNCPQYLIANYAALFLGAVVVNLNPMYTADELETQCGKTGVTTLFTFDMVLPNIRALCQEVDIPRVIVTKVTDYISGLGQSTKASLELDPKWYHFSELLDASTEYQTPAGPGEPRGSLP